MARSERYHRFVNRRGSSVTLTVYSGDADCPCMTSQSGDSNIKEYNPQWHEDFPLAAACNGTGKITNKVTTETALKAIITNDSEVLSKYFGEPGKESFGKRRKDFDAILIGAAENGIKFDLLAASLYTHKLTEGSSVFLITDVYDLMDVCQIAALKRMS